ncbi:MAG: type I DNA topoisomerase [Myxococcales bacterium]|nr:type I DNA topoisomerase [Polyangiaceae bacterium]MDW8250714.1 type I DNA topoisomerase [Myxococcales bacterium]
MSASTKPALREPMTSAATKQQTLVVVESPTKAKTMKKYLGPGYEVLASKGHVKDLPKKMGVDIEHDFQETYEIIEGKEKVLAELKDAAQRATRILLATDPDREGEAIAVHIAEELKGLKREIHRVMFHEITRKGIQEGIARPLELNQTLYEAQRTRRVLDRLVGYDVSALVWSKVAFGLSAGRVQSVALRLIVDREREIEAFKPEEYWNIGAVLLGKQKPSFVAKLAGAEGQKFRVHDGVTAAGVQADLASASFVVKAVQRREKRRNAPAPYTTSKLQQDASNYLHFTAKRTMQVAQSLYEGVDLEKDGGPVGLITYMRTDSTRVSDEAVKAVRDEIKKRYGAAYLPEKPNVFRSKKSVQDAHEAIRPTSMDFPPDLVKRHLKDEQYRLYKLIWDRFLASQMAPAVYDQTSVEIDASPTRQDRLRASYELRASGRVLKFAGWLEQYGKGLGKDSLAGEEEEQQDDSREEAESDDGMLPPLEQGDTLRLQDPGILAEQKFTQPPPRFHEGSLVRELEMRGIGRPSTYAEIISKVQARDYVEKLPGGAFKPTFLGMLVVDGLVRSRLDFIDPNFTAKMEEELDEVEAGHLGRVEFLRRFYSRFRQQLEESKKSKRWNPDPVDTGVACEACGEGTLQKRWSKNGWFLGCSRYPTCKNTRNIDEEGNEQAPPRETIFTCEKCQSGKLLLRQGRYGSFLGCSNYPKCDFTRPVPLGLSCPKCKVGEIIEIKSRKKGGRTFYGCSRYATENGCDYKMWQAPVRKGCPSCGAAFLVLAGNKKSPVLQCLAEGCGYKEEVAAEEVEELTRLEPPEEIFETVPTLTPSRLAPVVLLDGGPPSEPPSALRTTQPTQPSPKKAPGNKAAPKQASGKKTTAKKTLASEPPSIPLAPPAPPQILRRRK